MGGRGLTQLQAARRLDQATLGAVMIPCRTLLDVSLVMRLVRGFLKESSPLRSRRSTSGCGRPSSSRARLRRARQRQTTLTRRSRGKENLPHRFKEEGLHNQERGGCGEPSFNTCREGQTLLGQSLHDRGRSLQHS